MRKIICVLISIILIFGAVPAFADENNIYVFLKTAGKTIGNNYTNDNLPCFDADIKNTGSTAKTVDYLAYAKNSGGETVWSKNGRVTVEPSGKVTLRLTVDKKYYGVMTMNIDVTAAGDTVSASLAYTMSNHSADMPNNKKFGTVTHFSRGRGTVEEAAVLMKNAGIGIMRGEDMAWGSFEAQKGVYKLTDKQENVLNVLDKNDIDYMFIFNSSSPFYLKEGDLAYYPVSDEEGYKGLENYMTQLITAARGRIKYVEVWNEYSSKEMSGPYNENAEVNAALHRAVYSGVKAADENVKVVGMAADDWGVYKNGDFSKLNEGFVGKVLKLLNGKKCFDYVSIHPYPNPRTSCFEGNEKSDRFTGDLRSVLEKYGYDYYTPVIFSELGWCDDFVKDEALTAAYTVRAHAYTTAHGLAEAAVNYCLMDYGDLMSTNPGEATFGLVKSYGGYTSIPYLGKPAYVAVAYYNGLMADSVYNGEISTNIDSGFCYSFTDRNGRSVLMAGTADNSTENTYLKTDAEYVITSDMYGNEKTVYTYGGVIPLKLCGEPVYIIGAGENAAFTDSFQPDYSFAAYQTGEYSAKITGWSGGDAAITVFAPGKSWADINTADNAVNTDVIVYHDICKANADGSFDVSFNIKGISGEYSVSVYSVDRGVMLTQKKPFYFTSGTDKISVSDFGIYKNGEQIKTVDGVKTGDTITVKARVANNSESEKSVCMMLGVYGGENLNNIFIESGTAATGETAVIEKTVTVTEAIAACDEISAYLWSDTKTLVPLTESIKLRREL